MGKSRILSIFAVSCLSAIALGAQLGGEERSGVNARPRNPLVRVVTISQDGLQGKTAEALFDATLTRLDRAASYEPDIACLPEVFTRGEAESVPGPTTERMSRWAREHSCYVVCPIHVRQSGRVYNAAVLIDRQGRVVGQYHKIHPTEPELRAGTAPGVDDPPVFETDFGTIGIQICFDVNWHGSWQRLREKGAKIIFFPSAYPAARQARTLSWLNQIFVVGSTQGRASSIYDVTGDVLATTGQYQHWAGAVLPLGKTVFEIDFHISKMRAIQQKYGSRVEVAWRHDDDLVTLASLDPDLTVEDLIREYELTPHRDYIHRAQLQQDAARGADAR